MQESAPYLRTQLAELLVGQPEALERIVPYVEMYRAGLAPNGRPAGVFLLLGPTGTGKTRTVEALAEVLHGSARNVLKINCGEFQLEHEVAKLIGAPPGYLGHRETHPMLSQQKLTVATSPGCRLSMILFDEIEKAAPSFHRLLLGVLDRAELRLGDNSAVCFDNSMIFMTSNLGAKEMLEHLGPGFGFASALPVRENSARLDKVGSAALRRHFSPEFLNRVDACITYNPLNEPALARILEHELADLRELIRTRLGDEAFSVEFPEESRRLLIQRGTSAEYGARELKRTVLRSVLQPLGAMVASGEVPASSCVRVEPSPDGEPFKLNVIPATETAGRKNRGTKANVRRGGGPVYLRELAS